MPTTAPSTVLKKVACKNCEGPIRVTAAGYECTMCGAGNTFLSLIAKLTR